MPVAAAAFVHILRSVFHPADGPCVFPSIRSLTPLPSSSSLLPDMLTPQEQQQQQQQQSQDPQDTHKQTEGPLSDPRLSALSSALSTTTPNDVTLVLVADPSTSPPTQRASASSASPAAANIAAATVHSTPTFSGSDFFAASQDPSQHLNQLPLETPFFTPMAVWSEPQGDYFATASSTPAPNHHLQHPLATGYQTPAASFEYFPSSADHHSTNAAHHPPPSTGFQLPPSTPFSLTLPRAVPSNAGPGGAWAPYPASKMLLASDRTGSFPSIPSHRASLSMTVPMSSMLMTPGGMCMPSRPLSHSYSSPSVPAALLTELNMKEMGEIAVSELLGKVLSGDDRNAVMMLDMRPSMTNAASSIKTAVSVCIPNMLLKRPLYSLQMLTEQLTSEQDVETFSRWRQFATIVLFDASGAAPTVGSPALLMAQKFRKEGCSAALGYLQGKTMTAFALKLIFNRFLSN